MKGFPRLRIDFLYQVFGFRAIFRKSYGSAKSSLKCGKASASKSSALFY
jgi:hypothetical protein